MRQYCFMQLLVLFKILCCYQQVAHIKNNGPLGNQISEDIIYEGLKYRMSILQSKGHPLIFILSIWCDKSGVLY